jgi:hypothetical protein
MPADAHALAFVRSTMSKTEPVESGTTGNENIIRTYATRVERLADGWYAGIGAAPT